jgi:pimeloyl-ACP methyl ester carboxylesterase
MQSPPKLGRVAARAAAACVLVGAASAVYQVAAEAQDRRRFRPPGRLVDAGGRRVHVMEAGAGSPAVVIVPALGENVLGWVPVWRELARSARVCVYDRAGIGWSDAPPPGRRTFDDMADELHRTLVAARIAPPYLVVGHSMGGIIARRLATRYPGDMVGMVLVDSSHEDQTRRLGSAWRLARAVSRLLIQPLGLRRLAASAGLAPRFDADLDSEITAEYRAEARAIRLSSRHRRANVRELLTVICSRSQPPDLGSLPLTVLTAAESEPGWEQLQAELAASSARSLHVIADHGGHYLQEDDPALVIKAIRDLLAGMSSPGTYAADPLDGN